MNRNDSMTSNASSALYPQCSSVLSPLIKLERLVYRLNSIISINLDSLNEFEIKNHFKLLLKVIKLLKIELKQSP
jgi:hypothetical protein